MGFFIVGGDRSWQLQTYSHGRNRVLQKLPGFLGLDAGKGIVKKTRFLVGFKKPGWQKTRFLGWQKTRFLLGDGIFVFLFEGAIALANHKLTPTAETGFCRNYPVS